MFAKMQKFLILGLSKSGISATEYILSRGGKCYIYDDIKTERIEQVFNRLEGLGGIRVDKEKAKEIISEIDALIISPGVPINHELAVLAKKVGKRILGEFELGFSQLSPVTVAVTGTNGKTTTVSMVENVLSMAGVKNALVGNVGKPVCDNVDKIDNQMVCVAEVSSFQLESVSAFCPHIACVLNISPDHLERHYTMENYVFLKKRIFKNQTSSEYAVLNFDDDIVKSFSAEIKSKVIWVSDRERVDGAFVENGFINFKDEKVISVNELPLFGIHNRYNALFTVAICKLLGLSNEQIRYGLINFKGVKHRLELVLEKKGVKFFNDSKATNTASTISAINSIKGGIVLILGGSEKGENYNNLFVEIKKRGVKHVVLTGASKVNMLSSAVEVGFSDFSVTDGFESSIKIAYAFAENGDSVLFSPACASFDKFSSYEERGEAFIKTVGELD